MSCGNPHDKNCAEVLVELYRFIDQELDGASRAEIQHHLDECAPCLNHHELDILVRRLVARSCTDRAPEPLRDRVLLDVRRIVQVQVTETRPVDPLPWQGPPRTL
ncbi:MAG: mycothiol system anti-sigma-R factor [Actinomycetota bacterium]|nr:mycothiol system anti-sigma-R factor [Actinomycetota bacterium]